MNNLGGTFVRRKQSSAVRCCKRPSFSGLRWALRTKSGPRLCMGNRLEQSGALISLGCTRRAVDAGYPNFPGGWHRAKTTILTYYPPAVSHWSCNYLRMILHQPLLIFECACALFSLYVYHRYARNETSRSTVRRSHPGEQHTMRAPTDRWNRMRAALSMRIGIHCRRAGMELTALESKKGHTSVSCLTANSWLSDVVFC